ncbi:MAG TPA: serine/threonine-protein kinase [Baekduia sp.]|uniref:serine/threonine-protein kinase n=1 Tax=Baekduia sp. TaxID=2600305 RepID=UPI002D0CD766|nr:serine/threonine-protein kinase [Baekduia sp.]HMJ33536.1 serine/threonine-protein kinase [Baekduia sp.]
MADLETGSEFAGCRIEGVLGRGGMGVIYRATELRLGRPVALKLIATEQASDPDVRERFEREARMTASIEHPNVVPVYAAGEEDGHLYLVMRYVPGTDLHALLRREGRLAPARAASVVAQVGDALDAAHAAGLVHRDVKPANILIAGDHAYLSDFGITRVQSSETRITDSGNWIGTVDFMAPEHLCGEPTDARADVYALGCVLFTALTGTPPFRRDTVPVTITAHLHDPPPRPSDTLGVPAAFDSVLARALAKEPAGRFPSAGDLGRAARAAAAGEHVSTGRGSVATGAATPEQAEPTRIAPAAAATAIVAAGATATALAPAGPATEHAGAHGLRANGAAQARPTTGPTRPAAVKVQRGRGRKLALGATVVVLALPAILVVRWAGGGDGTPTGPLGGGEVRSVAESFADAYTNEDDTALRRLLTPAVRRFSPSDVQSGRPQVVGEYHRQFAADKVKEYALSDLTVTGGRVGRAEGRYTVTRDGAAPITGRIVLGVVRRNGKPAIDLIATEPRA